MNTNLSNKEYLDRKLVIDKNTKKPSYKEGEMIMNLWNIGTEEEQVKLANTLLEMMNTNK